MDDNKVAALVARTFTRGLSPTVSSPLLRDDIYAHIKSLIVKGKLAPGTQIRDIEIARVLSVSRTPVREAMRRLQDEGFIVAEASRWTRVSDLSTDTADEIYPIVGALERLCIESGTSPDAATLEELRLANRRLKEAIATQDAAAAAQADNDFHDILIAAAHNRRMQHLLHDLKTHLHRMEIAYFGGAGAGERSVEEHDLVIQALAAGDTAAAASALQHNWEASLQRMHERMSAHHGDGRTGSSPDDVTDAPGGA